MRILFTGASSFTGLEFVKALVSAGHEVIAPIRGSKSDYLGLREERLSALASIADIHWACAFGSRSFLKLISEFHIGFLCHHAAEVTNYRSQDFDVMSAVKNNTFEVREVLQELSSNSPAHVILTGSVFEADEGGGSRQRNAFSPYGLSKTLTSHVFRYWCSVTGVPLSKFTIPNPFGPLEEPRFCDYLYRSWKDGQVPVVRTPDYVRDNIPVDLLAACYSQFCKEAMNSGRSLKQAPSCYVESQGAFAQRMARELSPRLNIACEVNLGQQIDHSEPMLRINLDRARDLIKNWNEHNFWDQYAKYLCGRR